MGIFTGGVSLSEFSFQINVGSIKIGSIENASALNIGRNYLRSFESLSKTNQGLGNIHGDHNDLSSSMNKVEDPDLFDSCEIDDEIEKVLLVMTGKNKEQDTEKD